MTWVERVRHGLADGGGARLITWVWVLSWGEYAIGESADVASQLAVAAAVVLVIGWEVTQERLGSWSALPATLLLVGATALGAGEHLRESSYLLGWGAAVLVLSLPVRFAALAVLLGVVATSLVRAGQDPS